MNKLFKLDDLMCTLPMRQNVVIIGDGEKLFDGATRDYFDSDACRNNGKWYVFGIKVTDDSELRIEIIDRSEL